MVSPVGQKAIDHALAIGKAILKFVSPNDVGITGGHQSGYLLPKSGWHLFASFPPEKGHNQKSSPEVVWQDGQITKSVVTWYGNGTRSEYRLTRFGKHFPFLNPDLVGDLMVLIPESHEKFFVYFLDLDDEIEAIQTALGVEIVSTWAIYDRGAQQEPESENECLDRHFRKFVEQLTNFPQTKEFADSTHNIVKECLRNFGAMTNDDKLLCLVDAEYTLFRMAERKISEPEVTRIFKDVDDFLDTASRIMNRRKSRAGKSLENHVENLLAAAAIPFESQAKVDGKPDILIPGAEAYHDKSYPADKLFMIGVKRTCKDRWRQVLQEAPDIRKKHILTLQPGISANQLREMKAAGVTLIVPKKLHKSYPPDSGMNILSVDEFVVQVKSRLMLNG